jgi:hypothetical protein
VPVVRRRSSSDLLSNDRSAANALWRASGWQQRQFLTLWPGGYCKASDRSTRPRAGMSSRLTTTNEHDG